MAQEPGFNTYFRPAGPPVTAFQYLFDDTSGVFRVPYKSDFAANISVSGLSLSVGSVNLTGLNVVTLTGDTAVRVANGVVPVSGAMSVTFPSAQNVNVVNTPFVTLSSSSVTVDNTAPIPISGVVQASVSVGNVAVTGGSIQTIVTGAVSASFDTAPIVSAEASGNAYLANLSGRFGAAMAPLAVSGVVTASVSASNVDVVAALTTGNNYALVANMLLSGVSGQLAANLSDAAWVTGQMSLTNTAPIPVSGVTILGATATTQVTGWNTGLKVRTEPVTSLTTSNSTPSGVSPWTVMLTGVWTNQTGQIFAANPNRAMFFIQNIHTGVPLYVALGSNAASTGNFSFILNPSTQQGWGGSSFSDDHYRGPVCVSGGGWTAWEL